jgi:hypothetical protein
MIIYCIKKRTAYYETHDFSSMLDMPTAVVMYVIRDNSYTSTAPLVRKDDSFLLYRIEKRTVVRDSISSMLHMLV